MLWLLLGLYLLCQPPERYQKAVDITVDSLVTEAVDQMMVIKKQKQVVVDIESARDETEQQHSLGTVQTPERTLLAPLSTSTPADVRLPVSEYCVFTETNSSYRY